VVGSCEHGNEPWDSIKGGELHDYQLDPWSERPNFMSLWCLLISLTSFRIARDP
jgi:hypothetical protein